MTHLKSHFFSPLPNVPFLWSWGDLFVLLYGWCLQSYIDIHRMVPPLVHYVIYTINYLMSYVLSILLNFYTELTVCHVIYPRTLPQFVATKFFNLVENIVKRKIGIKCDYIRFWSVKMYLIFLKTDGIHQDFARAYKWPHLSSIVPSPL